MNEIIETWDFDLKMKFGMLISFLLNWIWIILKLHLNL